jgi:hypothetical protein
MCSWLAWVFAHATVGVLSLNIPVIAYWSDIGAIHSRTSHWHSNTAVSRSEFVINTFGFLPDTKFAMTNFGKTFPQTVGLSGEVSLNHNPPAPNPHASTHPMHIDGFWTSSNTFFGCELMCWSKVTQSQRHCARLPSLAILSGLLCIAAKAGNTRLLPMGIIMLAYISLPTSFCTLCNVTDNHLSIDLMVFVGFAEYKWHFGIVVLC